MIRVLHFSDPEQAHRRIAFLGVPEKEAQRLVSELRAILVSVPLADDVSSALPALLKARGIPCARGRDVLLLSVSSKAQLNHAVDGPMGSGDPFASLREAIDRHANREYALSCRDRTLTLAGSPRIMGILNVTPDSFSDGGKYLSFERAVERGREMVNDGADIIDVGGESTRPGSTPVPADVEISRVVPVLRALAERTEAILSVDTTKAIVARQAVAAGARIINDTSALADDPDMAGVVRDSGCAVVLMHRLGTPETMQDSPSYRSLFDEILDALCARVAAAEAAGIPEGRILVDPGIGFGKRLEDNLALHRHLSDLRNLGKPILLGPSRKAFLGRITGREPGDRALGTAACVAVAVLGGAHVVRVHDVSEAKDAVRVAHAVAGGVEC
ncbi:MAG: dihydropteroate synthase [Deltaproteobacteria bacterium]|nr:dihydropteroate synthase [Deltaproteobacteria bacterium]